MSANLRFLRLRSEGWHGLAKDYGSGYIQDGETPTEAAEICGMNAVQYVNDSLYRVLHQGTITRHADGTFTVENTRMERIGKSKLVAVLPDGTREPINRIVDWYDPLQPADLTRILDPLAEQLQLEGVGVLGRSAEIMFVQFELPEYVVGKDDLHKAYLLFGDDKNGGGIYQGLVNVRVECNNTWTASISELPSFGHADSAFTIQTCARVMAATIQAQQQERDLMNALFTRRSNKSERNAYAEAVFPEPAKPAKVELMEKAQETLSEKEAAEVTEAYDSRRVAYESGVELAHARRVHLMSEVQAFNDSMPEAANTMYALFNGLTAMARPDREVRDAENKKMFSGDETTRLANSLFGRGVNGTAVARGRQWLANAVGFKS